MEMIIGGAFQGKRALAETMYPHITWKNGGEISEKDLLSSRGIYGFHEYIRKELKAGNDVSGLARKLAEKNPDVILISDEVGYGIVPVDAFDRAYREAVGRVCTETAACSRKVVRVVCGIGTVIKDA